MDLGRLEEIKDLRKIWAHEALEFTPWLAKEENLSILGDTLGIDISLEETESSVGDFSVDILAKEAGTERKIIIENQLEDTNHDHLGKLITYASGKGADYLIWIVKRAREEHKSAIEWLNNHTDDDVSFFLVEVKVYRIGDSAPAPKFEIIQQPNNWAKEIKKVSSSSGDIANATHQSRLEFWSSFNNYAFNTERFPREFRRRKPSTDHWMSLYIGSSECHLELLQQRSRSAVGVNLLIDDNMEMFREIYSRKEEIEKELGFKLKWDEKPGKKSSSAGIESRCDFSTSPEEREKYFEWFIETAIKMKKVFKKYL